MYNLTKSDIRKNYVRIDNRTLPPLPGKYVVTFYVWQVKNGKRFGRETIIGVGTTKNLARAKPQKIMQRAQQNADIKYRRLFNLASGTDLLFRVRKTEIVTLRPKDTTIKRERRFNKKTGKGEYWTVVRRTDKGKREYTRSRWTNKRTEFVYDEELGRRYDIQMESDSVEMYDDFN